MSAVLGAGALISIDRRDRKAGAMLRVLQRQGIPLRASAAVIAQVWRDGSRQANLARVLAGVGVVSLDSGHGRRIGELLARAGISDVVDGHVALLLSPGDLLLTGDPADLRVLTSARGVAATVRRV